jgi:alpha-beta hydrolase superfamily lysophospholipase
MQALNRLPAGAAKQREDLPIRSGDDELAAWLYRPAGEEECGCVVLMHGFTATRDERLDRFCELLSNAGIAALAFDFRHLGASGGEPRQLIDLRRQYEDCDAALAHARDLDGVDGSRIVVWGASFAGGHALDAAARNPWLAAAICLAPLMDGAVPTRGMTPSRAAWATASGLRDFLRARKGNEPYTVPALGPAGSRAVIANQGAWETSKRVEPYSLWRNEVAARVLLQIPRHRPIRNARKVQCPLLVQVAEEETLLRNRPAESAARRAPQGTLRSYPGLDHFDVYWESGIDTVVADQVAFLRACGIVEGGRPIYGGIG